MIGLVIATHAALANQLLEAAQDILGPIDGARTLSLDRLADPEEMLKELAVLIDEVDRDGDGVLVMVDMFGGTPANLAARFLMDKPIEIISGVNLPMVLKFSSMRQTMELTKLTHFLQEYAQKSVVVSRDVLGCSR